jgi:hypothetical protein
MQQVHGNQSARSDSRGQYISYPVLQLLKSIQQEKEYFLTNTLQKKNNNNITSATSNEHVFDFF